MDGTTTKITAAITLHNEGERQMDINDLTLGQIRDLQTMFQTENIRAAPKSPHIGKQCIIRTYASGVHFGELVSQHERRVELKNSRRLWRWDAAPHGVSLSEIANHGTVGDRSKVCEVLPELSLLDALEVIPCSAAASSVIAAYKVHTP